MTFPSFSSFFSRVHGVPPYDWQVRLADRVVTGVSWDRVVAFPTGAGKTAVVDVALYAAAEAASRGLLTVHPRRIVVVVDRRVLVDQVWEYGCVLLRAIAMDRRLRPVRDALRRLSAELPSSVRLRGACPADPFWCRSADQVQIVVGTVDHVGSRLLMRGYGVHPGMRSVEAGLIGQDSVLFLDQVHLSTALAATLDRLGELDTVRNLVPRRSVVHLSTSVPDPDSGVFGLQQSDFADPVLRPRLEACRVIRWSNRSIAKLLSGVDAPTVLLVANTIGTAIDWFGIASKREASVQPSDAARAVFLITGSMRPLQRADVLKEVSFRLAAGLPTLVVATQCIEAAVDWDFSALVTECAAWDSIVQRLGRLNRRGSASQADCFVVPAFRKRDARANKDLCPIYGEAELVVAAWLAEAGALSCPPARLPAPPDGCLREPSPPPLLLPEYLDLWSQTRAAGRAYDVSAFLHGARADRYVHVVWRDFDLRADADRLQTLIDVLPPSSLEAASVRLVLLRRWLGVRPVLRIRNRVETVLPRMVSAGDTVVVPLAYGGIGDHLTFDASDHRVEDLTVAALQEVHGVSYAFYRAPAFLPGVDPNRQVRAWIAASPDRAFLRTWVWLDAGRRWLFVSSLPAVAHSDASSLRARRVALSVHLPAVARRAREVAVNLQLGSLVRDVELGARLHDLGKLDSRFQGLLGRPPGHEPLAKGSGAWFAFRDAARLNGYPPGERHESVSVELMRRSHLHRGAVDPELVEHLIASHHGWARPFTTLPVDSAEVSDTLLGRRFDARVEHAEAARAPARFRVVQQRYGWHGLAWLEAVLRLSDHRQSDLEASEPSLEPVVSGLPKSSPSMSSPAALPSLAVPALNGFVVGDYLAALGVLHALHIADESSFLSWRGTIPIYSCALDSDALVARLLDAHTQFAGEWPGPLNKMDASQRLDLLGVSDGPFRSLVVAMMTSAGSSPFDFVSAGRGGFTTVFDSVVAPSARFSASALQASLFGSRPFASLVKSFRWNALAAYGAQRPRPATNDKRGEPWLEWLSLLGVCAFVAVPVVDRWRFMARTASGFRGSPAALRLRWPLWQMPLSWSDVPYAVAATPGSLASAFWCEAERLVCGLAPNLTFAFGPAVPVATARPRRLFPDSSTVSVCHY